jgi:sulfide:quinone oxidoreductase
VLVAGAGVAALEAALALDHLAGSAVEVHLIAPTREFVHRPMSVGEPFGRGAAQRLPIVNMLKGRRIGHVFDEIGRVFPKERRLVTKLGLSCDYDALIVATGARAEDALPGSLSFGGPQSVDAYRRLLHALTVRRVRRLAFALPHECLWGLPLYELALMTAAYLFERRVAGADLTLSTHERGPLEAFGPQGSARVAALLGRNGIAVETGTAPALVRPGELILEDGRAVRADAVVSIPRLEGRRHAGLPHDERGFLPVDEHGRVRGVDGVWAAGDGTDHPLKQGGLAAQQADAAAESIAAWAGAAIRPRPYKPVLRGLLLTDEEPEYLRAEPYPHGGGRFASRQKPLWWPPAKVASRYLAPVLAANGAGTGRPGEHALPTNG